MLPLNKTAFITIQKEYMKYFYWLRSFNIKKILCLIFMSLSIFCFIGSPKISICNTINKEYSIGHDYNNIGFNYGDVYDFIIARLCEAQGIIDSTKILEKSSKQLENGLYRYSKNGWIIIWGRSQGDNKIVISEVIADRSTFLDNTLPRLIHRFNPINKKQTRYLCETYELDINATKNQINFIKIKIHGE